RDGRARVDLRGALEARGQGRGELSRQVQVGDWQAEPAQERGRLQQRARQRRRRLRPTSEGGRVSSIRFEEFDRILGELNPNLRPFPSRTKRSSMIYIRGNYHPDSGQYELQEQLAYPSPSHGS